MKIGVSTLALFPMSLEEILDYLESIKVEYCEIIREYPYDYIDVDLVNSYSLKTSVHAPLSDMNIASLNEVIRRASIEEIKNSMDLASKIDASVVVVHPGQIAFLARKFEQKGIENSLNSLKECSEHADELGINMCVENMPDMEGLLFKDIKDLNELVQKIEASMTLDVGHAHNMGYSVQEMLKYGNIGHIHLSDNDGSFDNHDAVGSETVDFKSLFKELNKIKFKGINVVEVKQQGEILKSLDYINNLIN